MNINYYIDWRASQFAFELEYWLENFLYISKYLISY